MQKYKQLLKTISTAKPSRLLLFTIITLSIFSTISSLIFPLITKQVIDSFSESSSLPFFWIALLGCSLLMGAITSGANFYFLGKVGNDMLVNIRNKSLKRTIHLPISYFDSHSSSEPASRIVKDTELVNDLISKELEPVISGTLTLVISIFILWFIDWKLTSVLFFTLLGAVCIVIPVGAKLVTVSKKAQEQEAAFLGKIIDYFSQLRLIKAYTAENKAIESSSITLKELYKHKQHEVRISAIMAPVAQFTVLITLIIILGYGSLRVSQGVITMGTLIAFVLYIFNIAAPLFQLTFFTISLNKAMGASERIQEIFIFDNELDYSGKQIDVKNKNLFFDSISFQYSDETKIFNDFSLQVSANETLALVGESGSGKTSLFSLLLRFYSPNKGEISLNGTSINNFDINSWRSQISYIQQDSPLLSGSIMDNLLLGMNELPDSKTVNEILNYSHLKEFVDSLPKGLDTQVGEHGSKLSGGQKQRLAIARAMLADNPILLCDEATSNLDSITEHKIKNAMKKLALNKTTIIAAHRLSTVVDADRIIVLQNGKIVGDGSHAELMKTQSYYRDLVEHQLSFSDAQLDTKTTI